MPIAEHNDDFWINDILLTVPPTQISISEDSFNYTWQTLRTNTSQKTKSGHASIEINVRIAFVGMEDINENLRRVVAQLRYYPFCYIDNDHIRNNLFPKPKADTNDIASTRETIVLAMRQMNISTSPGEPETLWLTIQFAYFNYLPYIPIWQYKEELFGEGADKVVSDPAFSTAWLQFITPAERKTSRVPELGHDVDISFLELRTAPVSSVQNLETAQEILKTLGDNPEPLFNYLRTNTKVSENSTQTVEDAIRNTMPQFSDLTDLNGSIDVILPILLEATPKTKLQGKSTGTDQHKIQEAIGILQQRIDQRADADQATQGLAEQDFTPIPQLTGHDNNGQGFGVFKKERVISLAPHNDIVVTGISININNILATIPLIGQRYATFQHIGSIDATVSLNLQVTSDAALRSIQWFYHTVNDNMLNNRHIPQGLQTIRIDNPLLKLFGLKEFITGDIDTDTIPGSPGTYEVNLSLIESGLKGTDRLDSPTDKFQLEYASSDPRLVKEMVKILNNHITYKNKLYDKKLGDQRNIQFDEILTKYLSSVGYNLAKWSQARKARQAGSPNTMLDRGDNALINQHSYASKQKAIRETGIPPAGPKHKTVGGIPTELIGDVPDMSFNTFIDQIEDLLIKYGDDISFSYLFFGLTDDDVPGMSFAQQAIHRRLREKTQNLDTGLLTVIKRPYHELTLEARKKVANKERVSQVKQQRKLQRAFNNGPDGANNVVTRNVSPTAQFDMYGISVIAKQQLGINQTIATSSKEGPTAEELVFTDLLEQDITRILQTTPFIEWSNFLSNLVLTIVETDLIELPEFKTLKELVASLNIGRGLPAYQDFALENILEGADVNDIDKILSLDPDIFLFSTIDSNINNFIDTSLIAGAKHFAQSSVNNAMSDIRKHYHDSYLPKFISDNVRAKLEQNIDIKIVKQGKKEPQVISKGLDQYYEGATSIGKFYNAASGLGGHQTIRVGSVIDTRDATASVKDEKDIRTENNIWQTLNPNDLFITQPGLTPRDQLVNTPEIKVAPEPNSKGGFFANGAKLYPPMDGELKIAGPNGVLGSLRDGGARSHRGVDLAGNMGSAIYSIADGTILKIGENGTHGFRILISHAGGYTSNYFHLQVPQKVSSGYHIDGNTILKQGSKVKGGQFIGLLGRTGVHNPKTPTHLHFQLYGPGAPPDKPINPFDLFTITKYNGVKVKPIANHGAKHGPELGIAAGVSVLDRSLEEFQKSLQNGQAQRLVRAFPAFKLYFIQDDSNNRRRFGLDDFFSYNAVSEITVVRSRKIPADFCEIVLTNVSGVLSNRKFQHGRVVTDEEPQGIDISSAPLDKNGNEVVPNLNGADRDTARENPLASMMVNPGVDIELRLGFANDPNKLTTVFVGKIMEVEFSESDDLVRITCQSYAIELVQNIKGMAKPIEKDGWFISDARTDLLLEQMITEPEVIHFGRWVRSKSIDTNTNSNRFLLTNKYRLTPSPQDDNIFVPPISELNKYDDGWFLNNLKYSIYQTTIWDIFDEMTLRHPGWIKSAVPYRDKYGPRMTMFFGIPSQLYFATDPSIDEKKAIASLKTIANIRETEKLLEASNPVNLKTNNVLDLKNTDLGITTKESITEKRLKLAQDHGSIKPFRNYHLVTDKHHIISNTIRATSKGVFNTISIQHGSSSYNEELQQLVQEDFEILTLPIDAALPDEDVREMFAQYPNCQNVFMARKYALALLMRELKDVYQGELTIIGNPNIKPYDIVQIFDAYSDLMGPVEVEQVIHRFSQDTGFITEITPDLFVTSNEWVNMTTAEYMSLVLEGTCSALNNNTSNLTFTETFAQSKGAKIALAGAAIVGATLVSPLTAMIGIGAYIGGKFMMQRMADFSTHGQPIVIHPLIHRGRPFVAGLPLQKLNNLWTVDKGQWIKEGMEGLDLWWEDFNDKMTLAAGTGNIGNVFSGSTVPAKF